MAKPKSKRLLFVNTLDGLGYISCLLQWLWLAALVLPSVLKNEHMQSWLAPPPTTAEPVAPMVDPSSLLMTIVAIIITLAILAITVVVLVRIPLAIAKAGKKVTTATSEVILPVITHHQKLPEAKKRTLSVVLVKCVKLALCLLPVAGLGLLLFIPTELDPRLGIFVGLMFVIGSVVWFSLEYAAARLLGVPLEKIV